MNDLFAVPSITGTSVRTVRYGWLLPSRWALIRSASRTRCRAGTTGGSRRSPSWCGPARSTPGTPQRSSPPSRPLARPPSRGRRLGATVTGPPSRGRRHGAALLMPARSGRCRRRPRRRREAGRRPARSAGGHTMHGDHRPGVQRRPGRAAGEHIPGCHSAPSAMRMDSASSPGVRPYNGTGVRPPESRIKAR